MIIAPALAESNRCSLQNRTALHISAQPSAPKTWSVELDSNQRSSSSKHDGDDLTPLPTDITKRGNKRKQIFLARSHQRRSRTVFRLFSRDVTVYYATHILAASMGIEPT